MTPRHPSRRTWTAPWPRPACARRADPARAALLGQLLVGARVGAGWLLRPAGDARMLAQASESRLPLRLALLVAMQVLGSTLWIGSWWLLGWMSATGRPDLGWLVAWLLLLLSSVPCRLTVTALGGALAIQAGAILKRRLLVGSLALDPDEARRSGIGRLYGLVLESELVEQVGLVGGFLALAAALELALAVPVLALGAGGWRHAALLLATIAAALGLALRYGGVRRRWTEDRLEMTNDLVERMIGHRTRLAQEPRARRHDDEDRALERYLGPSRRLDHLGAGLRVLVPRGWLIVGLLGLAPAFVSGGAPPATMAVGLGGVLLAYQALRSLAEAVEGVAAAAIAWGLLEPLLKAAGHRDPAGHPDYAVPPPPAVSQAESRPRLDARDLVFGYRDRAEPVLRGASLIVGDGARILLRGPSGGGKSTLVALLAGLRAPASGLLLWDGLDLGTLGTQGWRRRVALAPQFHENHVLMGTFAFNLLMGRGWPPRQADLEEAERGLPRPGPRAAAGSDAGRHPSDPRRDRLAAQPRRAQPPVPGACPAPGRRPHHPRRELRRPRPPYPPRRPLLRPGAGADGPGRGASLRLRSSAAHRPTSGGPAEKRPGGRRNT